METYKFKCTTKSSDSFLLGFWSITIIFSAFATCLILYTHPELIRLIKSHEVLAGLVFLLLYFLWSPFAYKVLSIAVKEFTVQLDNLTVTVWENGKEILHGKASACKIKTKPGKYTIVDITVGAENLSFRGGASYYKVPVTGFIRKSPFGSSSPEDQRNLLALGKALRQNLGFDAEASHRLGEAAAAEADLEKNWNRDIPEMDDLSPEENKIISRRAKLQILMICGILLSIELFFLKWLASEYPFIMSFFDFISETMSPAGTWEQRIVLCMGYAVSMLPIVLLILLPDIVLFFGFRKKFIRRAARKWCRHWRLASDEGTTDTFTFEDVKAGMDSLRYKQIKYLILSPPAGTMHSPFMQTYHQEENLFVLEVKIKEKDGPAVYKKSSLTKEQVLYAMYNYMNKQRIPDTSDWEKISSSLRKALLQKALE